MKRTKYEQSMKAREREREKVEDIGDWCTAGLQELSCERDTTRWIRRCQTPAAAEL